MPEKKSKLYFQDDVKNLKKSKFQMANESVTGAVLGGAGAAAHKKMEQSENDNAAVEAAHQSELAGEKGARLLQRSRRKQYKKQKYTNANPINKWYQKQHQKQQMKKRYREAYRTAGNGKVAAERAATAKGMALRLGEVIKKYLVENKKAFIVIGGGILLLILLVSGLGSCSMMLSESGAVLASTTYLSDDDAIHLVENQYVSKETGLRQKLDRIERDYPGYDEYNYDIAQIGHNPYSLVSYLSAKYKIIDASDPAVKTDLQAMFDQQYTLTITRKVEVRYRAETRTYSYTDPITGETETDTYTVEVPYNYYILNVKLENNGQDRYIRNQLNDDQIALFTSYQQTMGNRSYLFGDDVYSSSFAEGDYKNYEIPREALSNQRFAALMAEATKYLGYPYVWGGSSPSTSFDCSGFVCWVFRQSGVYNIGRTTAQGIYNQCSYVSPQNAKPGDIVFFTGTYDSGCVVSHVGIYVGDGMMIHCGNPIQYASINSTYWQKHFYAFGRLN